MANITIRNLPDATKETLRVQAAQAGMSLEALARTILQSASLADTAKQPGIVELAGQYFGKKQGVDLELPERKTKRQAVEFNQ